MMNAVALCFAGDVNSWAFKDVFNGKNSFENAVCAGASFPCVSKIVVLAREADVKSGLFSTLNSAASKNGAVETEIISKTEWDADLFFNETSRASEGFDFSYLFWGDCPFLDVSLASILKDRHEKYPAEYTYSDGRPYGLAPELFKAGALGVLAALNNGSKDPVSRDIAFNVLQKDINSFDIETEISPVDLRAHRVFLCADSKRGLLLLKRFVDLGFNGYMDAERLILNEKQSLRTLPAFFSVQTSSSCPRECEICPYPALKKDPSFTGEMPVEKFASLMSKIEDFAGDGVIDVSLWGELSLHSESEKIVEAVLSRESLALIIETSGFGWKDEVLEKITELVKKAEAVKAHRSFSLPPLSWIVSLDCDESGRYAPAEGEKTNEAVLFAQKLIKLFPKSAYVQAVRRAGFEDEIERFYKYWKTKTNNVIIQKYDVFGPKSDAEKEFDISPVERESCWHIMRDMYIFLNGAVAVCKEDLKALCGTPELGVLGCVFTENLESIWKKGEALYAAHCEKKWEGVCAGCDEYYTFNF
jgi:spiro-SPASM protein